MIECGQRGRHGAARSVPSMVRYNEDVAAVMTEFIEEQRQKLKLTSSDNTFLRGCCL